MSFREIWRGDTVGSELVQGEVASMYAAAVELLVEKANLAPGVALAFAEAIDMALKEAQFVTVPILDARFAVSEARTEALIRELRGDLQARLGQTQSGLESKIELVKSELESKIGQVKSELLVRMEQVKAELVRWLFLLVIGNAAITAALSAIQRVH